MQGFRPKAVTVTMPKKTITSYSLYDANTQLPSIYKKRAAKELKEVPEQVTAHLESFRRWLQSMPHLKCPTGMYYALF